MASLIEAVYLKHAATDDVDGVAQLRTWPRMGLELNSILTSLNIDA